MTLLGDWRRPDGVTFAFTERAGGVSEGGYASLNLGADCGDDPAAVAENRRRTLAAMGAEALVGRLVNPLQVHGTNVVTVRGGSADDVAKAQGLAREGADAIVCTAPDVPVLLCYADCVPVVLTAPEGFAVVHSGWRGTIARISALALDELCREAGCEPADVRAYVGPHVGVRDYEVSPELASTFANEFGTCVVGPGNTLDLGAAVVAALRDRGVPLGAIACVEESTASTTERFYSYRASHGDCGRLGALAFMAGPIVGEV